MGDFGWRRWLGRIGRREERSGWSWWLYVKSSVLVHVKMVYRKYKTLYVTVCVVFMVLIE